MFSNKKRNMEYIDVSSLPANFIGGHRTRMRFFVRFDSRRDPLSRAVLSLSLSLPDSSLFSLNISPSFFLLSFFTLTANVPPDYYSLSSASGSLRAAITAACMRNLYLGDGNRPDENAHT